MKLRPGAGSLTRCHLQPHQKPVKLSAINIGVAYITRKNRTRDRNLYGEKRFDHEELHTLQIHFVKLRDQFRGELAAGHHLAKTIFILEHDVEGQLKRPGILAANQFGKLPELAHFLTPPMSQILERHAKRLAGIIEMPHMIGAKAINGTHVGARRRKWKGKIADQTFLLRNGVMQSRMPDDGQNICRQRLRSCHNVDDQSDLMAFDLRTRFKLPERAIATVNAKLQGVVARI